MFKLITKYFDYNERELNSLRKSVTQINALEDRARALKDSDFPKETEKLKNQVQSGEKTLNELLPWAYALVREASRRTLGLRHFDVQLIAGVALHSNKVAEQKTGEGKTLTATAPLYLNALSGIVAHLVTVNDYLAILHAGWMGTVYHFLGLTTSAIIADKSFIYDPSYTDGESQDWRLSHLKEITRKEAYQADITYGINSEFGFDYLRDNMAQSSEGLVQRGFNYAIIDEADSVLIDEARTPHIISQPYAQETTQYYRYAKIVNQLKPAEDYLIDEKLKTAHLTEKGISKIESALGVTNIYEKDFDTLFHIEAALKAETLFKNDKDYIVKDGEVIIVDEFTGRLLYGRRFSEGLHQAIEAKENVSIQQESKTLATVSLQNYFRMYDKLGGMTGTASTEAEEFHKIYKLDVIVIPTHMPMVRKDHADMIYKNERAKYNAVVNEIIEQYKKGRPVLVGTTSIDKNELLSRLLNQKGVPHELLNAKNHEREAHIIARAGEKGAITIATNMAGRGVDIILGGEPGEDKSERREWQKRHDEVVSLGGLYVLGTERHESRRIDNQLRGRAGRQGDPGETRFFVSLEDELMRIFGGEQIGKVMSAFNFPEDEPLSHSLVSKAIEQAQVKVEGFNFDIRKHLVEYDDVLNKQREIIYTLRRKILNLHRDDAEKFRETVFTTFTEQVSTLTNNFEVLGDSSTKEELDGMLADLQSIIPFDEEGFKKMLRKKDYESLQKHLMDQVKHEFERKEKQIGTEGWLQLVSHIYLQLIDQYWTEHLTAIEDLREGINLRGYAQMDPLVAYKNEAFEMFEKLLNGLYFEGMRRVMKIEIELVQDAEIVEEKKDKRLEYKSASSVNAFQEAVKEPSMPTAAHEHVEIQSQNIGRKEPAVNQLLEVDPVLGIKIISPGIQKPKLGRNDPCWCGSGKKWKKCHYPN